LTRLVGVMKRGPLANILYEPYAKDEKPELSPSVRSKLVDVFADDISRLEGLLDTDLGRWKRKTGK